MASVIAFLLLICVGAWGKAAESTGTTPSSVLGPSARRTSSIMASRGQLPAARPINLTRSPADERSPAWSPSGDMIAFTANGVDTDADGRIDTVTAARFLYTMYANGSGLTGYAKALPPGDVLGVAWHPDNRSLFLIIHDSGHHSIVSLSLDTAAARTIYTIGDVIGSLAVSPDGNTVYFDARIADRWHIYHVPCEGAPLARRLTFGVSSNRTPTVAGSAVLFISNRTGSWRVYRMDLDGKRVQALTTSTATGDDLAVRPTADGRRLILLSTRRAGAGDAAVTPRLWTMPYAAEGASAGAPIQPVLRYANPLTAGLMQLDPAPQVAAGREQTMLFVSLQTGNSDIYLDTIVEEAPLPIPYLAARHAPRTEPLRLALMHATMVRARSGSQFTFTVTRDARVTIVIRARTGRVVRRVAANLAAAAGQHIVQWDGRDDQRRLLPSGIYLYEITARAETQSARYVGVLPITHSSSGQ